MYFILSYITEFVPYYNSGVTRTQLFYAHSGNVYKNPTIMVDILMEIVSSKSTIFPLSPIIKEENILC